MTIRATEPHRARGMHRRTVGCSVAADTAVGLRFTCCLRLLEQDGRPCSADRGRLRLARRWWLPMKLLEIRDRRRQSVRRPSNHALPFVGANWRKPPSFIQFKTSTPASKSREQHLVVVDVLQASSRKQCGCSCRDDDVFIQLRTIPDSESNILANAVSDPDLEQQNFQRLSAIEAEIAGIGEGAQVRRQVKIRACIENVNSRINEVRLTFFLIASKTGQEAGRVR